MTEFTAANAECLVFTFKEGLLSKIAHDLKLRVKDFRIAVTSDPVAIDATFSAQSLEVVTAMKDGEANPSALSESDKSKIAKQIGAEVLHASQYPEVTFVSSTVNETASGSLQISGTLSLHGTQQAMTIKTRENQGRQIAELTLHQPDFGITPYKAMMGTLKVKADVRVQLSVPVLSAPQ